MEITKTQLNYLMAIRKLTGSKVTLTNISTYLGVKKSTVSVALKYLEESGYITKHENPSGNEYILCGKAWDIIDGLGRERFEFMSLFNEYLGLDYEVCEKEYHSLCGLFGSEFIKSLGNLREGGYGGKAADDNDKKEYCSIPYGKYHIPFQVVQSTERIRSMGDKGFVHPAVLIIDDNRQDIIIESKKIYYKSKQNQSLYGQLRSLYWLNGDMKWIKAEHEDENTWRIPLDKILYQKNDCGRLSIGMIKIKASATTVKMPESVAEITFNFEMIEQIK